MRILEKIPSGIKEVLSMYGNPDLDCNHVVDMKWMDENLKYFELPFPLRIAWRPEQSVIKILAHKLVGEAIVDVYDELKSTIGIETMRRNDLDLYGGCWCFRQKRKGAELSTHAFGIAVDVNPHLGQMGKPSTMPEAIVSAFKKRRFQWGGDWDYPDGMHFQACKEY